MTNQRLMRQKLTAATDLINLAREDVSGSAYTDAAYNLHLAEQTVQAAIRMCVEKAREAGDSWMEIGLAVALTPQGAQQRYGLRPTPAVDAAAELAAGQLALTDDDGLPVT